MRPFCLGDRVTVFTNMNEFSQEKNNKSEMQSPNIFSNEHGVLDTDFKNENLENKMAVNIDLFDNCEEDENIEIAALEEHTRQLLIELQSKRNEASIKVLMSNLECGWAERERGAMMKAEAAENRAQCATSAAYRLAEEREILNKMVTESKGKYDILKKENDLLTAQIRSLSSDISAYERRERESAAERVSYESTKRILQEKMDKVKNFIEEIKRWMSTTEETMKLFREEADAARGLESKVKEEISKRDAQIENLEKKLKEATDTITKMASQIGTLKARDTRF